MFSLIIFLNSESNGKEDASVRIKNPWYQVVPGGTMWCIFLFASAASAGITLSICETVQMELDGVCWGFYRDVVCHFFRDMVFGDILSLNYWDIFVFSFSKGS